MKFFLTILFSCLLLDITASPKIYIYTEKHDDGFAVYVDNNDHCPISIQFDFNLRNLSSSNGNHRIFVVPAGETKHFITRLKIQNRYKESGYDLDCTSSYGDHFREGYDQDYPYSLPYEQGRNVLVSQGYNGRFSHQGLNALDFDLPMGSEVHAARDGVVIEVVQDNDRGCLRPDCVEYDNYIVVYHSDGTFADYSHLKKNGAMVKEGDRVKKGELIAYSGNTGYSSDPHLHFEVFLQKMTDRKSLRTKFLINNGSETAYLREQEEYLRAY